MAAKNDPFSVDDDDKAQRANQEDADKLREIEKASDEEVREIEVDDEEPGDDDEPGQPQPAGQPGVRQEKKDRRWAEHTERARRAEADNAALREQVAQQSQQVQQLMGLMGRFVPQQPAAPDPIDRSIEEIQKERIALVNQYNEAVRAHYATTRQTQLPAERDAEFQSRSQALEDKLYDAKVEQRLRKLGIRPQDPNEAGRAAAEAIVRSKWPDVAANKQAFAYANATYERELAAGSAPGPLLADQCMEDARKRFRTQPQGPSRPAPSAGMRRKFMGAPAGGSGGSNGATTVRLTSEQIGMAKKAFPGMSEKQAVSAWVRAMGGEK